MERERGWSPITIHARRLRIEEFLRQVCAPDRRLSEITPADIDQAIARKSTQDDCVRASVQAYASTLRAFLRYAETRGWCAPELASAVASPRVFQGENLPAGPTWADVQRLLSSVQGDSRTEIRDRAILLLFAVYGLRVSEVRRLKLEDIDWEHDLLVINRSKQLSRKQTYPLSQAVGEAIVRYLKEVRPRCSHREVFVSLKAPIQPLSNSAFWKVVSERLRPFDLPIRHCGPHALRHACATHLLAEGFDDERDRRSSRPSLLTNHCPLRQGGHHRPARGRRLRVGRADMTLDALITQYVAFRQSLGEDFKSPARLLRAFGREMGAGIKVTEVEPDRVKAFLDGARPLTSYWHRKHSTLRGLFDYARKHGLIASSPLPTQIPKRPQVHIPFIYTRDELCRLLKATATFRKHTRQIEPDTLRTLVLLLYGAGLRVGEALALDLADVDWVAAMLTIRDTKFHKTRLVPLGADLKLALSNYAGARSPAAQSKAADNPFLAGKNGARLTYHAVSKAFRQLRAEAGVHRADGARYQPRLHDMRHSFAVHRLTAWYEAGANVQRLLPKLSTYLGHISLSATQVYLTMTPELLQAAAGRFAQYAFQEVNDD